MPRSLDSLELGQGSCNVGLFGCEETGLVRTRPRVDSVVAVLSVGSGAAAAGVVADMEIGEFAAILFDVG